MHLMHSSVVLIWCAVTTATILSLLMFVWYKMALLHEPWDERIDYLAIKMYNRFANPILRIIRKCIPIWNKQTISYHVRSFLDALNAEVVWYYQIQSKMNANPSSFPQELNQLILEYAFPAPIRQFASKGVAVKMLIKTWKLNNPTIALILEFTFESTPPFHINHRQNAFGYDGSIEQILDMNYIAGIVREVRFIVFYGTKQTKNKGNALEYDMMNHQFLSRADQ